MISKDRLWRPWTPLAIYVGLTILSMMVFGLWPDIDLEAARLFFDGHGFMGRTISEKAAREFFADLPFVILAVYAALWLTRNRGRKTGWAPSARAMVLLVDTLLLATAIS